jgi:heme exporter protein B
MNLLSNTRVLVAKEFRTEFRSRELLTTTGVFILVVLVLFSFSLDTGPAEARAFTPGLLWLAFLFAASLMLQPCFLREQVNDTISALRLAVGDPFSIFLAKVIANMVFLLFTQLLILPVFAILYDANIFPVFGWILLVFFLGSLGVSVGGTALAAISAQSRMRELLLPVLLLPVLTPVLVSSTQVTRGLLEPHPVVEWKGIAFLAVFDTLFLTVLWLFGEYLLEE